VTVGVLAVACSTSPPDSTALAVVAEAPTTTPTPVPTTAPLSVPTATPPPTPPATATAVPTATLAPTSTPIPPTATAEPTQVPPPATEVPVPTSAPAPTATTEPTAIPEPTATAEPTAEPTVEPAGSGGPPANHVVTNVGYVPLGSVGSTTLYVPAARVELVGFHEASHPGAQAINAAVAGLQLMDLASRGRGTPGRSAADIVVPPGEPLRAPVTGTVVSSTNYVLYCQYTDKLVYIEPDGLPGWQVRLFHVTGEVPPVGTRVIAGETIVATGGANPLPFESQVDEFTAEPSWPHTHLEVVDTNVPDDRPPGGGC